MSSARRVGNPSRSSDRAPSNSSGYGYISTEDGSVQHHVPDDAESTTNSTVVQVAPPRDLTEGISVYYHCACGNEYESYYNCNCHVWLKHQNKDGTLNMDVASKGAQLRALEERKPGANRKPFAQGSYPPNTTKSGKDFSSEVLKGGGSRSMVAHPAVNKRLPGQPAFESHQKSSKRSDGPLYVWQKDGYTNRNEYVYRANDGMSSAGSTDVYEPKVCETDKQAGKSFPPGRRVNSGK